MKNCTWPFFLWIQFPIRLCSLFFCYNHHPPEEVETTLSLEFKKKKKSRGNNKNITNGSKLITWYVDSGVKFTILITIFVTLSI